MYANEWETPGYNGSGDDYDDGDYDADDCEPSGFVPFIFTSERERALIQRNDAESEKIRAEEDEAFAE